MSATAACAPAAATKTDAAASTAATAEMETALPPPPPPIGVAITGAVSTPLPISIRVTAAVAAAATTPTAQLHQLQAERPASHSASSASLPRLLLHRHRGRHCPWWRSSLPLHSLRWWASWGSSLTPSPLHRRPLLASHRPETNNKKTNVCLFFLIHFGFIAVSLFFVCFLFYEISSSSSSSTADRVCVQEAVIYFLFNLYFLIQCNKFL